MRNVFTPNDADYYIKCVNQLQDNAVAKWGRMNVAQMLAHLNTSYETIYEPKKHPKPGMLAKWLMKTFVKPKVLNPKPYKQNLPTTRMFIIKEEKDFEAEKKRLIGFIQKTQQLGAESFEGKENISFGALSSKEWNILLAKHLNHHLAQFNALI